MSGGSGTSATLHGALDAAAREHPDVRAVFPSEGESIGYRGLAAASRVMARGLVERGVTVGSPVGFLCPNAPEFLSVLFAATRAGGAACPLPLPAGMRGTAAFLERLSRIVAAAGMRTIVVSHRFEAFAAPLREALPGVDVVLAAELSDGAAGERSLSVLGLSEAGLPTIGADDLAVVQFTSGSTALPKGVCLTHGNVLASLDAIKLGIALGQADGGGFWLPLFHDMGLFGTLSAILTGIPVHVWSPAAFVKRPGRWLREFLASGATITAMPNFGYDYLVAAVDADEAAALDLAHWRIAFNGAEPIAAASVEAFLDRFTPGGFRAEALFPVYGMAEATLPVTFPPLGRAPAFDWVERDRLAAEGRAVPSSRDFSGARAVAAVGRAVAHMEVRIAEPATDRPLPDMEVGEIQIRGASVTSGYLRGPDDPRVTGRRMTGKQMNGHQLNGHHDVDGSSPSGEFTADGWLHTGDLGYLRSGELFVTGRTKEMITVRGANFYPQDAEAVAREVPGVSKGRCVAVAEVDPDGKECLLVIAESGRSGDEAAALVDEIRRRVSDAVGLSEIAVHLVPPRSIPRTSSGKFQRLAAREQVRQARVAQSAVPPVPLPTGG